MDSLERMIRDIKNYEKENGRPYEKLIIFKKFLADDADELRKKSGKNGSPVRGRITLPFPNIKMSDDEDFDYKFLP